MGMRMSTWWGTWTMIQWKKKLRPNRARSTVVPSIWPLNLVHSRRFHQRIDGLHVVDVDERGDDVGEGQERDDQHLDDHPCRTGHEPYIATPRAPRSSDAMATKVHTMMRSRRTALAQRAGGAPTIILCHQTSRR